MAYFRSLAEMKPDVRKGHVLLAELIAAGEIPVGLTVYNSNAESLKRRGAPIDWLPVEPVVGRPQGIAVARNAPHPHAALLFVDFVLSPEGQELLNSMGRVPVSTKVKTDLNRFPYTMVDPGGDGARRAGEMEQALGGPIHPEVTKARLSSVANSIRLTSITGEEDELGITTLASRLASPRDGASPRHDAGDGDSNGSPHVRSLPRSIVATGRRRGGAGAAAPRARPPAERGGAPGPPPPPPPPPAPARPATPPPPGTTPHPPPGGSRPRSRSRRRPRARLGAEPNALWLQDNISLTSVGIDIGSAGTQVIFSRLHMRRMGEELVEPLFRGRAARRSTSRRSRSRPMRARRASTTRRSAASSTRRTPPPACIPTRSTPAR